METIESITKQIMDDPRDAEFTKRGEKPVFSAPSTALITIVGQSPVWTRRRAACAGTTAAVIPCANGSMWTKRRSTIPESSHSCRWTSTILATSYGDKGMEEPREWVAPTYHPAIMKLLPDVKLTILAGSYAVKYYLNQWSKARLEDTVKNFHNTCPSTSRLCIRRAVPTSGAPSIRGSMRRWCRHCASMCMPSSASEIAQFQWCKSPVFVVTANTGDFDMRALTPV